MACSANQNYHWQLRYTTFYNPMGVAMKCTKQTIFCGLHPFLQMAMTFSISESTTVIDGQTCGLFGSKLWHETLVESFKCQTSFSDLFMELAHTQVTNNNLVVFDNELFLLNKEILVLFITVYLIHIIPSSPADVQLQN